VDTLGGVAMWTAAFANETDPDKVTKLEESNSLEVQYKELWSAAADLPQVPSDSHPRNCNNYTSSLEQ
jgi:hypothetical protein